MNKLQKGFLKSKGLVLDSREVAEMLGVEHKYILKKLEGSESTKIIGIIPVLNEGGIDPVQYFIESTYKDAKGEERKCYLFTKMGCEFIANKFTGEKGILFTAKYVEKFHQMEQKLNNPLQTYLSMCEEDRAIAYFTKLKEAKLLETKIKEDEPLVALAKKRLTKEGLVSVTDTTKSFNLKRGQATKWAKEQGYIHKRILEVNNKGEGYFRVYDNGGFKAIGVTEEGLQLINNNLKEIQAI